MRERRTLRSASASDAVAGVRARGRVLEAVQQREHRVAAAARRQHRRSPSPSKHTAPSRLPARDVRNPNAAAAASARSRFS